MSHLPGHIDGKNDEQYNVTTTTVPPAAPSETNPDPYADYIAGVVAETVGAMTENSGLRPIGEGGRVVVDAQTGEPTFVQGLFYEGMQNELLFGNLSPELQIYNDVLTDIRDAAVQGGFLKKSDLPPVGETNDKLNAFINHVFARANELTPTVAEQTAIMDKLGPNVSDGVKRLYLYRTVLMDATADILENPPTIEVTPYIAPDPTAMKQSVKAYMRQKLGREASENEMRNLAALLSNEYKLQYENQIKNEIANTEFIPINNVENLDVDGELTSYDPQAAFVEKFENMYANDIDFVERKAAERASFAQFRQAIAAGQDFMSG